jgi:hypothetical protein
VKPAARSSSNVRNVSAEVCERPNLASSGVVECLRAETRAIHTQFSKRTQLIARDGARIHFHVISEPLSTRTVDATLRESIQLGRRQQRRRTATEVDRINVRPHSRRRDLVNERANIRFRKFA